MRDTTLQRVWDSRSAISQRCGFDSRKLVQFYQSRQKPDRTRRVGATSEMRREVGRD